MKRYDEFYELLKDNNLYTQYIIKYANKELNTFLNGIGSDIVMYENTKPMCMFKLNIDEKIYYIGVTSIFERNGNKRNYYWIDTNN